MKRILAIATVLLLAGCGKDKAESFRKGFPQAKDVKVDVPQKAGQALEGVAQRHDGLQGQVANFYLFTRGITVVCNTATVWVLGLVKAISDNPPTSVNANVAVWGPHTDALSPNTFKFTVTKVADNDYTYTLEGKGKAEPDSAFKVVLSGAHKVATNAAGSPTENFGNGTFLIDWDKIQQLPEHGKEVGSAEFTYSRLTAAANVKIDIAFHQVKDDETGKLVDAQYKYDATPAAGGSFEFQIAKDLDNGAPGKTAIENMAIKSRWQQTGAGRSDVQAKGGDLGALTAQVSECWDQNFNSLYLIASWAPGYGYGQQTACAFPNAEYSTLAPLAP